MDVRLAVQTTTSGKSMAAAFSYHRRSPNDTAQTEVRIGLLPLSALCGKRSKSAEEAKAHQIRHELAMSGEERVELAFRLGERRYSR